MKKIFISTWGMFFALAPVWGQNVGIGTSTPSTKLDVNGSVSTNTNIYAAGNIGVGFFPNETLTYKLTVKNGSFAIYDPNDDMYWRMNYDAFGNRFQVSTVIAGSTVQRMVVTNSGNVGINNISPLYRLDIGGNLRASGDIKTEASLYVSGNAYVDDNKGLVRASTADLGNMKIHKANYTVTAILGAHAASGEFTIAWPAGIFSIAPSVYACNETYTFGTVGELRRVIVKIYDCDTDSCKARLINTDSGAVNYEIRFDVVMIGR
ncbi:MAG TPA: hypothetical protein VLL95_05965 [Phnomibacter sp.]|nr:hypothetical protein [Phnomibacter sp.]